MRFLTGKQIITFAVVSVLLLGLVSMNSAAQNVSAQTGAVTATKAANAPNKLLCPDTSKPIVTPTPTATVATPTVTATPPTDPVVFASSRLTKLTQQGEFSLVHTILDFESGVTSTPYFFQSQVNLLIIQGHITYCSGSLQRVLVPGDSWTVPAQARFTLSNTESDLARLSLVALEPATVTATPTGSVTVTPAGSVTVTSTGTATTPTPSPSLVPSQTGTAAVGAAAYLGIRAAAVDNTGIRVVALLPNSPAGAAQVQVGDIITAVNGQTIASLLPASAATATLNPNEVSPIVTAFFQLIAQHRPGETIQLTIQRGSQTLTFPVKLGALPA